MKNLKAIIFDAYGTLFDVNSAAKKCKDRIGNKWENFANYWRTTQLEYTWLRSLMNKHKDFWQITEDSLDKSMKKFQIDHSMRVELLELYKILSPYPETKITLEQLKKRNYKIAILSNGTPSLFVWYPNIIKIGPKISSIIAGIISIPGIAYPSIQLTVPS